MDDLLDLTWSPSPSSSAPKIAPKPAHLAGNPAKRTASPSAFDLLAASASPKPAYYNSGISSIPQSGRSSPAVPSATGPVGATAGGKDAFSSLLSFNPPSSGTGPKVNGFSGGFSNGGTIEMSLADQQAKLARERKEKDEADKRAFDFGMLGGMSSGNVSRSTTPSALPLAPVKIALQPTFKPPTASPSQHAKKDSWNFDDLLSTPASTSKLPSASTKPAAQPKDPWDMDHFTASVPKSGSPRSSVPSRSRTPGDFDWGDREDQAEEEDDILGMLSKPVEQARQRPVESSSPKTTTSRPTASSSTSNRPPSPPPHILGRIVEMGFSPSEARKALAQTSTGLDVESALELLLNSRPSSAAVPTAQPSFADDDGDDEAARAAERRRRRRQGPSRQNVADAPSGSGASTPALSVVDIQEQADKLLSSASEMGRGFLGKASGLWNVGKERAMKVYAENAAAAAAGGGGGGKRVDDGRPKWMQQAEMDREEDGEVGLRNGVTGQGDRGQERKNGRPKWDTVDEDEVLPQKHPQDPVPRATKPPIDLFRDEDDDSIPPSILPQRNGRPLTSSKPAPPPTSAPSSGYASPARRKVIDRSTALSSTPSRPATPLKTRKIITASAHQISTSATHKTAGNEQFKLGKFSEAAATYSSAISALPDGHLLLIPLLNNRATSHLKSGAHGPAISDCSIVIEIIGMDYHPAKETPLPSDLKEIILAEGLVKAVGKRASGHEMAEKWDKAKSDWEALMSLLGGPVGSYLGSERAGRERTLAHEGLGRCKKMLDVLSGAPPPSKPLARTKPTPKPAPTPSDPNTSTAVSSLRLAAAAAETESALQLSFKDSVDSRVLLWSSGKETNLRGLLAGLDAVLGEAGREAMGLKKVGMADLVTEKQVKIGYMRVIGKLHPDKLDVAKTTVEQRMIANGVFGILNKAWHAFQGL